LYIYYKYATIRGQSEAFQSTLIPTIYGYKCQSNECTFAITATTHWVKTKEMARFEERERPKVQFAAICRWWERRRDDRESRSFCSFHLDIGIVGGTAALDSIPASPIPVGHHPPTTPYNPIQPATPFEAAHWAVYIALTHSFIAFIVGLRFPAVVHIFFLPTILSFFGLVFSFSFFSRLLGFMKMRLGLRHTQKRQTNRRKDRQTDGRTDIAESEAREAQK